jgi:hypothetical protein
MISGDYVKGLPAWVWWLAIIALVLTSAAWGWTAQLCR